MKAEVFFGALIASLIASISLACVTLLFEIRLDYWLTVLGTVITSLAFGFGTYFVVLAIDAYSQLQVIRGSADDARALAGAMKQKEDHFVKLESDLSSLQGKVSIVGQRLHESGEKILQIVVDYALLVKPSGKTGEQAREKLIRQAHCIRNRFILQSEFANAEQKRMAILALQQYGDNEALPIIREICQHADDDKLRQVCEVAIKAIEDINKGK